LASALAPDYQAVPPEHLPHVIEVHQRVLAGEEVVWTYEIVGLLGRQRCVEAHSVPYRMPDGQTVHLCISRDIEDRQRAHEALQRSEERLRLAQEATGLAEFESGDDGVARFSERFATQAGLPPGTTHLGFADWIGLIHPDDRALMRDTITGSLNNAGSSDCEFRIVRPD